MRCTYANTLSPRLTCMPCLHSPSVYMADMQQCARRPHPQAMGQQRPVIGPLCSKDRKEMQWGTGCAQHSGA